MRVKISEEKERKGFSLRLEARLKNAALVSARESLGLSAKEAAKKIGINYSTYVNYEGLKAYPSKESQEKICGFYNSQGILIIEDDIFPPELGGIRMQKMVLERTVESHQLLSLHGARKIRALPSASPSYEVEKRELKEEAEKVLKELGKTKPLYVQALRLRLGFDGDPQTYEQIGEIMGVTTERARQTCEAGLAKLRGKHRSRNLADYVENLNQD